MILKYFEQKAVGDRSILIDDDQPSWTSDRNASLAAWKFVEESRKEKINHIKLHHKVTDFPSKSSYQIKPSEVARALKINRTTLMHTSTYSEHFSTYLAHVNAELESLKDAQIESKKLSRSRGTIRNNKDQLVAINAGLKQRINELEQLKIRELVTYAFDQLPLPVKKKLGID
ncbi:MAG TPA: hypothetical protein DIW64_14225 [Cellvibrio sp.]|nr:hypothetical protein [Cellvibrio sp.]